MDTVFCFLDDNRVCNGACAAFSPVDREGPLTNCRLINSIEGGGKALITIARAFKFKNVPGTLTPPPEVL